MNPEDQGTGDVFDVEKIRELVELMQEFDINEVDLRQNRQKIHLRRGAEQPTIVHAQAPQMMQSAPAAGPPPATSAAPAASKETADAAYIAYITSPMIGTFYAKPNPEAEPYVKVGDVVSPDTAVCQIESMKFFNEIKAEVSGKVVEVMVENQDSVDVNAKLFKIDTR